MVKPLHVALMRARELCLERAHQFLGLTDWNALVLAAANGDRELAADALELMDECAPDPAGIRPGQQFLQRHTPAELRFYSAGMVFDFYAKGGVFLAEDSPEARYAGSPVYYLRDRTVAELAAVIGKACAVAAVRPPRPRAPPAPRTEQPAPPPAREANPYKAGYTQDPDAEERE